ncbi:MAG: ABC transporter permease subunit [Proteobacteria bacterium]|nr:ABC transporter permease subunit [Desulfobacula sp.]MBU3953854.1 ABC transporter permease subunit [Pseudomonadota bacterium]MBU4133008.1 ABC transporter permease subunit [Pseudomonadota bacterium]
MASPLWDRAFRLFAWGCSLVLMGAFLVIIGFLCIKGYTALTPRLIFGDTGFWDAVLLRRQVFDGLFPAMAGTLCLIMLSIVLAVPLGLSTGIFLAEYASPRVKWFFSLVFDILAGIPSIVVGLFGFCITLFLHQCFFDRLYPCLLISALSLAFLVLPYMIRTTQMALESLPVSVRLTAPSLGATQLQNIVYVLLPAALSTILSGIILSIGRCAEDTAVIMLTGAVATAGIPKSVFSSYEALPFYIYYISSQYADHSELIKGYGACLVLIFICMNLFVLSHFLKKRLSQRLLFRH